MSGEPDDKIYSDISINIGKTVKGSFIIITAKYLLFLFVATKYQKSMFLQHNWLIDNKMKATPCAIKGTVSRNFLSVFGQFRENIRFVCQSSSVCWVYEWQLKKLFPLFLLRSQWKTIKFFPRWPCSQCRVIVDNAETVNYCMFKNMSAKWLNYLNYLRLFISGRKYCVYFLFKVIQLHTNFNQ